MKHGKYKTIWANSVSVWINLGLVVKNGNWRYTPVCYIWPALSYSHEIIVVDFSCPAFDQIFHLSWTRFSLVYQFIPFDVWLVICK